MKTLADAYTDTPETITLFDAPTGQAIPDRPDEYEVLGECEHHGYLCRAVRGPSGEIDVEGPHAGVLNRNVLDSPDDLPAWLASNYPA